MTATSDTVQHAKIEHAIVYVNAETAKRWLKRNVKNRNLNQTYVERYRADMAAGRWSMTGDPIRFAIDGTLIDGQHRLAALAELDDVTLPMLVIRNLANEAQGAMDQGQRRTAGQQLQLSGIKDSNAVAAAVKRFIVWDEGLLFRDNKVVTATVTTPRIEEWVHANRAEVERFSQLISLTKQNDAPPSVAGAAALAFARIDFPAAVQFFTLLARGAGTEGHPIVTLDKRLQRNRREGLKMPDRDYLALFILAWNAWRAGREMKKFQRPRGGRWSEENFPHPA